MATSKVFVVGPGYVGREIIDLLRAEGKYDITTLVRREAAAKEFQQDGMAYPMLCRLTNLTRAINRRQGCARRSQRLRRD